jgi:hypothetical protein
MTPRISHRISSIAESATLAVDAKAKALKAAGRYGQDVASQEYQNAYNRYNTDYNMKLGPLQTLAGYGQTSTNNLTNTTGTYGANQAENIATGGNIRASSYMNAADALARGASQYLRN